jgi:response regulator RpfG family c-di-GMP phosphodiesterase
MKIIRTHSDALPKGDALAPHGAWKLLVVDDEPDVRRLTAMNLRGFEFLGRGLHLLEAGSVAQAKELLDQHPDIAVALVDVVMETDDAGLRLVEHIRKERGNAIMRLVIRTGQPGTAPELYVIDNYDIDDYRDKTELTAQKLYSTVRLALKGYRDLQTIELNRAGLSRILAVTPDLYNLHRDKLEEYFQGVLMQLIGIWKLGHSGMISTIDGMVLTVEGHDIRIRAGAGDLEVGDHTEVRRQQIAELCARVVKGEPVPEGLRDGALVIPLQIRDDVFGFVYLESGEKLSHNDRELIQILANQCAAGLDNFRLHHSLEESYEEVIDMLGQVAEFKDSATGTHIIRIQEYTRRLALALGQTVEMADTFANASRLHDIGKVGIADALLRKPGKLDADERLAMQRHSEIGDTILKRAPSLAVARIVARSHHERWDGTGYPDGTAGAEIPYVARVVAVADVFDALVSTRPYKGPWQVDIAVEEIRKGIGSHFDPDVANAFIALYDRGALADLIALASVQAATALQPA